MKDCTFRLCPRPDIPKETLSPERKALPSCCVYDRNRKRVHSIRQKRFGCGCLPAGWAKLKNSGNRYLLSSPDAQHGTHLGCAPAANEFSMGPPLNLVASPRKRASGRREKELFRCAVTCLRPHGTPFLMVTRRSISRVGRLIGDCHTVRKSAPFRINCSLCEDRERRNSQRSRA